MGDVLAYDGAKRSGNLQRLPPQAIEAEQSVLGAVLLDDEAINQALEILIPEDFYRETHREIFRAMMELSDHNQPVDGITLTDALRTKGLLEQIGGPAYIAELAESVPTAMHVAHYARIVRDKAILRRAHTAAREIAVRALDNPSDVPEFLATAERLIAPIFDTIAKASDSESASILAPKTLARMEESVHRGAPTGTATGFIDLDRLTGGGHPGESILLAGSTGSGKTTCAMTLTAYCASKGIGVAYFSLEMSKEQLMTRLLCSEAGVYASKARSGRFSPTDLERLGAKAAEVAAWPLTIVEGALTPSRLKSLCRRFARQGKLGLAVVDYLHLMSPEKRADNREREISAISRAIKLLAMELQIPILSLAQLNRRPMVDARRPQLSDLRESGQLENDADQVWFIYREDGHDPERANQPGVAEIIVAKQRNGPTGIAKLFHRPELVRFDNLDEHHDMNVATNGNGRADVA